MKAMNISYSDGQVVLVYPNILLEVREYHDYWRRWRTDAILPMRFKYLKATPSTNHI